MNIVIIYIYIYIYIYIERERERERETHTHTHTHTQIHTHTLLPANLENNNIDFSRWTQTLQIKKRGTQPKLFLNAKQTRKVNSCKTD
jgi:hypothetical protein